MNKSIKAALLSALVFPGAGHFFLKKHMTGTVLAAATVVSLYFLISTAVERVLTITAEIQRGEVQLDVAAIMELVLRQPMGNEAQLLNIASAVLLLAWLISIVDSYRIGRAQGNSLR